MLTAFSPPPTAPSPPFIPNIGVMPYRHGRAPASDYDAAVGFVAALAILAALAALAWILDRRWLNPRS